MHFGARKKAQIMTAHMKIKKNLNQSLSTKTEVWDIAVRVFHWSLVLLVTTTAITGFLAAEWWLDFHVWAGYGIALLLMFRLAWGFVGSYYARFASFLFPLGELSSHLRDVMGGKSKQYIGHNPAGALMVFALIFVLFGLVISGLIGLGGQENLGLLAAFADHQSAIVALELHEILSFLLLAMIIAHLLGVAVESFLSRENLVQAMITGKKNVKAHPFVTTFSTGQIVTRVFGIVALIAIIAGSAYWWLAKYPASGFIAMEKNITWASECGDCHQAYHPSLLPRSSWATMMDKLADHFGENATIDKEMEAEIRTFLSKYASEKWDSEAANGYRKVAPDKPLQITASPYWKQRHAGIEQSVFKRQSIRLAGNCLACHKDAASGRFADSAIAIPE